MLITLESLYLKIFLRWPFFIINSAYRTKLYRDISLPQLTDTAPQFPLETYSLYSLSLTELREKL